MVLTEERGRGIAKFYTALIEELVKVDPDGKTTARAIDLVKQIGKLIAILTISLIAIVALTILAPAENVAAGLLLLGGMVAGIYFLMKKLASNDFQNASKGMIYGLLGISTLILSLTLSLTLLTVISDKYKEPKVILGALALLVAIVLVSSRLMKLLSRNNIKESSKESLITIGAILLLFIGMSLSMMLAIEVGKKGKEALIGGLLVVAFAVGASYLIKFLAKIRKSTLLKGLISTAVIALMIAGISAAMLVFGEFLKKLNGITNKTIAWGIGLTVAMIVGMIGLVHLLSPLAIDPFFWAGFGMVETIAIMIASISGTMLLFSNLLKEIKNLSKEDIQDAVDKLIMKDGMVDALSSIIDALDDFGIKSAIKVAAIGKSIQPVISSISQFVDVVQKMASLQVADQWDKNGNPIHYLKLEPNKFNEAADNLTGAFTTFISELGKGLEDVSIKSTIVLKLLGGDISGVLQGIGAAFNPIIQIATGKMQVGDQTVDITLPKLNQAAKDVVKVISTIITDLSALKDNEIDFDDFEGAFACVDRVIEMIGKIAISEVAKEDFPKKINEILMPGIHGIFGFLQSTAYIDKADSNANSFEDAMIDFVDGIKELERIQMNSFNNEFEGHSTNLVNGLNGIITYLNVTDFKTTKSNSSVFKDVMKNTATGINHIKPFLSSTPKQIVDLANAMKQLDAELITKEEQRTKAIQLVASNFKDMAEGVNQLNKAMAESMRLTRLYDQMKSVTSGNIIAKGVSAAVEGAGAVASKVKEALNDNNKSEEQQKAKEETKQKDREELAAIIGNAVSAALTAWSESHRDLTVQFSDSPEKIFGEVYHN